MMPFFNYSLTKIKFLFSNNNGNTFTLYQVLVRNIIVVLVWYWQVQNYNKPVMNAL